MKVCWISNTPAPYKVDFMNCLGKEVELHCIFEAHSYAHRDQSWYNYHFDHFTAEFLDEGNIRTIIRNASHENDILISSDYSSRVCRYAVRQFHRLGKKTWMLVDGGLAVPRSILDYVISYEMKKYDFYLSSGDAVNEKYFDFYKVNRDQICNYHLACMSTEEIAECAEMRRNRDKYRKQFGLMNKTVLLSIGQQVPRKGFDILVKAMKNVPRDVELFIIGGAPQEEVKRYVEENQLLNIHFIPFLNKESLAEYYAASDVFILPTRYDIWGLVINEAMAYGLPIISTDRCIAAMEMERNYKNAIIVPVEDVNCLQGAINQLIGNPELRKDLSRRSLIAVQNYSYEKMVLDFINHLSGEL